MLSFHGFLTLFFMPFQISLHFLSWTHCKTVLTLGQGSFFFALLAFFLTPFLDAYSDVFAYFFTLGS